MQLGASIRVAVAGAALAVAASGSEAARDLNNRGVAAYQAGRLAEAESQYGCALREWQAAGDLKGEAATLGNLAVLCRTAGRNTEAAALFGRALAALEAAGEAGTRQAATLLINYASFERGLGRTEKAEDAARRAVAILERQTGAVEALASGLNELAAVVMEAGKPDEAAHLLDRARKAYTAAFGASDPRTAPLLNNLAVVALARQQFSEAEAASRDALALWESAFGPEHSKVAAALTQSRPRFVALGLVLFSSLALAVAAFGAHRVISYSV